MPEDNKILDVSRPGTTPASPTSKPVISTLGSPVVDPMMAPKGSLNLDTSGTTSSMANSTNTMMPEQVKAEDTQIEIIPQGPNQSSEVLESSEIATNKVPAATVDQKTDTGNPYNMTPEEFAEATREKQDQQNKDRLNNTVQELKENITNPETGHSLVQKQATFAQVGSHKSHKWVYIILAILTIFGVSAAYIYYFSGIFT